MANEDNTWGEDISLAEQGTFRLEWVSVSHNHSKIASIPLASLQAAVLTPAQRLSMCVPEQTETAHKFQ